MKLAPSGEAVQGGALRRSTGTSDSSRQVARRSRSLGAAKLIKDHSIHSIASHARLSTRNTNISPHVVSDPQFRRRSMCSVAVFAQGFASWAEDCYVSEGNPFVLRWGTKNL